MKHHPTYEREVEIVRNKLAPATGTTVIELGRNWLPADPK